jgi:hypothetical protein
MRVEGGHILKFFLPRYNFFLMPPINNKYALILAILEKKNSHDYALIPAMKSKDFKEMKGF